MSGCPRRLTLEWTEIAQPPKFFILFGGAKSGRAERSFPFRWLTGRLRRALRRIGLGFHPSVLSALFVFGLLLPTFVFDDALVFIVCHDCVPCRVKSEDTGFLNELSTEALARFNTNAPDTVLRFLR